jgi:hypothetical protein
MEMILDISVNIFIIIKMTNTDKNTLSEANKYESAKIKITMNKHEKNIFIAYKIQKNNNVFIFMCFSNIII